LSASGGSRRPLEEPSQRDQVVPDDLAYAPPRRREGFANLFHCEAFVEIKERDEPFALLELAYDVDELGAQLRSHLAARILVEEAAVPGGLEPRLFGYLGLRRRSPSFRTNLLVVFSTSRRASGRAGAAGCAS